jgi:hypothetical protein
MKDRLLAAKNSFIQSCRQYQKSSINNEQMKQSYNELKAVLIKKTKPGEMLNSQFVRSEFEKRFSEWKPTQLCPLLLVTVGCPDGVGDADHLFTIHRILKHMDNLECSAVLFVPNSRKESYDRLIAERKVDDVSIFYFESFDEATTNPALPEELINKFSSDPILYISVNGGAAPFVRKRRTNQASKQAKDHFLAEFGGSPGQYDIFGIHDGHMGIGPNARGIPFHETLLNATRKPLRERQHDFTLEDKTLEQVMLQGKSVAEYFDNTELFRAYFQGDGEYTTPWYDHYVRSIVFSRADSQKNIDFSMGLPKTFDLAEFVKINGEFFKEFGVGSIDVFKDGKQESVRLADGVGKKLRFFTHYLSPADEIMMYSVASGPAGGSGDNTYAKALSYHPKSRESKEDLAPLPFFQLPWGFGHPNKTNFIKEIIHAAIKEPQSTLSSDNLQKGYAELIQYFEIVLDFIYKSESEQINASRQCGKLIKSEQLNEAYNHFLAQIQKQSLEHNVQTMVRTIMAETCYPALAAIGSNLFSNMTSGWIAYEDGMFMWNTLCDAIIFPEKELKAELIEEPSDKKIVEKKKIGSSTRFFDEQAPLQGYTLTFNREQNSIFIKSQQKIPIFNLDFGGIVDSAVTSVVDDGFIYRIQLKNNELLNNNESKLFNTAEEIEKFLQEIGIVKSQQGKRVKKQ